MFVGLGNDHLSCERRTWNTVLFHGPCSQIYDLTMLRTEWAPRVGFPGRVLVAQGTSHECSVPSGTNEIQLPERT